MKISHVEKSRDGYIVHIENKTEEKDPIVCQEIRGSIIVPDALKERPGYYLLLGQKREEGKDLLIFLKEESEHSREALIEKIKNDEGRFRYHKIYTEEPLKSTPGEQRDSFFIDLRKTFNKNISWVKLCPALYRDDITHGVDLFSQWRNDGALEIPRDTILYRQIGSIEPGVPPDESSYAFHALRHILSGFKIREIPIDQIEKEREEAFRKDSLKDLTGVDRVAAEEIDRVRREIEEDNEW